MMTITENKEELTMSKKLTAIQANGQEIRRLLDNGYSLIAEFKNRESRGRDTYGYNCNSLYIGGLKVGSNTGGNYSQCGVSMAEFIGNAYKLEINKLSEKAVLNDNGYSDGREYGLNGIITVIYKDGSRHVFVDGGFGERSMEDILKAVGLHWQYLKRDTYRICKESTNAK